MRYYFSDEPAFDFAFYPLIYSRILTEGWPASRSTKCEGWSQWSGLNRRPTVYETVALPLSYIGLRH